MDPKDIDIARLTIDRDLEKSRVELERLKGGLAQQVADAKVQIGEMAIERMSKAFAEFRSWILIAATILGALGFLGYYQVSAYVQKTISAKIDDWLSLERKGAILKDTLESTRMRVALDALVVRMERTKLSEHYSLRLELSDAEKSRLVAYMLDPSTSDSDFRDGASVLAAHVGRFFPSNDAKIDELLVASFGSRRANDERLWMLLESLRYYRPMGAYAREVLKQPGLSDGSRYLALRALAATDSDAAQMYARTHLNEDSSPLVQKQAAQLLAVNQGDQALLDSWLQKQAAKDDGALEYVKVADRLAPMLGSTVIELDSSQRDWARRRAAHLLVAAIKRGVRITVSDSMSDRSIAFKGRGAWEVQNPDLLFQQNDAVLNAMGEAAVAHQIEPEVFVRALTTKTRRGEIFALQVEMNRASMTGATFGRIDASMVVGPVMLLSVGGVNPIQASFRGRDGRWVEDRISSFDQFYSSTLHFAYDEAFLQLARSRTLKNLGSWE